MIDCGRDEIERSKRIVWILIGSQRESDRRRDRYIITASSDDVEGANAGTGSDIGEFILLPRTFTQHTRAATMGRLLRDPIGNTAGLSNHKVMKCNSRNVSNLLDNVGGLQSQHRSSNGAQVGESLPIDMATECSSALTVGAPTLIRCCCVQKTSCVSNTYDNVDRLRARDRSPNVSRADREYAHQPVLIASCCYASMTGTRYGQVRWYRGDGRRWRMSAGRTASRGA